MAHIIYYDTETTGIRADKDRIIEIAAYDPVNDRKFDELINPGIPIPAEASAVHGIYNEDVQDKPSFAEVGAKFIEFCAGDSVLCAHNNDSFDKRFLEAECERHGLDMPEWKFIDSLKWARKYRPDLPKHSLQFLRELYGVEANNAHRAFDDVVVLWKVFTGMTDNLPVETILQLLSKGMQITKMPFGKYQGRPLKDVPRDYVKWLDESGALDKEENQDLKKALLAV